ncbi:hypothetical protein [Chryseobacterium camelliae]|uniref:hypothetical protein n=1 Tax=Chryseobacterium camelliae TaxID=1265445 RepID=UPI00285D3D3F|nr:hypothetical protein [Chryseobacterium camelliae]MDR6514839.1 hypothetical protein [Chryseobacterium camelliae]
MKILLLSLMLISCLVFSQDYEFNYLLTYKVNRVKPQAKQLDDDKVYINSEDHSYDMNSYSLNKQQVNWIKDFKAELSYRFDVLEKENGYDRYTYQYARRFIRDDKENRRFVNHVEIEKTGENTYLIKALRNKKTNFTIDIELEKSDSDLIYFQLPDIPECTEKRILSEFRRVLHGENYVVKKAKFDYRNGYIITEELIELKAIQKKNSLPDNIRQMVAKQFENYKKDQ